MITFFAGIYVGGLIYSVVAVLFAALNEDIQLRCLWLLPFWPLVLIVSLYVELNKHMTN